jgi:hypothetical protein
MLDSIKIKSSRSLRKAFEMILKIFEEESTYYEDTINSLKGKVSELEDSLLQMKKENMNYQVRISKLKGKLRTISKTVSKLEDSDFEVKINNKENEKSESNNYGNKFNQLKYRNTETINSFRRKTKLISDINVNKNQLNQNYVKLSTIDNEKLNFNGEDINRSFDKKNHKKTLSTKIKNSILNINQQANIKKKNDENSLIRSNMNNEEDVSVYLVNNYNENDNVLNKADISFDKIDKKKNTPSRDKYIKIKQKIKGLKSALTIYNKSDLNSTGNYPNSVNDRSEYVKSSRYVI